MSSVDYVNLLGAGAGFDTKALVAALVEAERLPKKNAIDAKIDDATVELSGISEAAATLETLRASSRTLDDAFDFNFYSVSNSQTSALTVSATGEAKEASHSITVTSVAAEERRVSGEFASQGTTINGGAAFDLTVTIGSSSPVSHTVSISSGSANPVGIVSAINEANLGLTAELLQTGASSGYKIQIIGETGSEEAFSITSPPSDLSFSSTKTAADAVLTVDGVTFTRSSNTFTDVISGANISLHSATSGSATVSLNNDNSVAKAAIESFVDQVNASMGDFKTLIDSSKDGALSSNSVFRQIFRDLMAIFTNESSTPGTSITRLTDIGLSFSREGTLEIDESTLDSMLSSNFTEIRKIFSADTDNQTRLGDASRGIAGDLAKMISDVTGSSGYFSLRTSTIEDKSNEYATDLEELEERLLRIEARYTKQFSAMQQVVNEMNSLRDSLTSTFENLPYSNKNK